MKHVRRLRANGTLVGIKKRREQGKWTRRVVKFCYLLLSLAGRHQELTINTINPRSRTTAEENVELNNPQKGPQVSRFQHFQHSKQSIPFRCTRGNNTFFWRRGKRAAKRGARGGEFRCKHSGSTENDILSAQSRNRMISRQ